MYREVVRRRFGFAFFGSFPPRTLRFKAYPI